MDIQSKIKSLSLRFSSWRYSLKFFLKLRWDIDSSNVKVSYGKFNIEIQNPEGFEARSKVESAEPLEETEIIFTLSYGKIKLQLDSSGNVTISGLNVLDFERKYVLTTSHRDEEHLYLKKLMLNDDKARLDELRQERLTQTMTQQIKAYDTTQLQKAIRTEYRSILKEVLEEEYQTHALAKLELNRGGKS